jgi:hypothetical protein
MFNFLRNLAKPNYPQTTKMPSTASTTYVVGEALVLANGALVHAAGSTEPTFICGQAYAAPATGNEDITVIPVTGTQEWKTTFYGDPTNVVPGDFVTIHTDSAQVTATETNGVVEIVKMFGTTSGSEVIIKF